jgi:uncharacterized flavoprotein (TIGR03862 family)
VRGERVTRSIAVIGAGPAGLMAAEVLADAGTAVTVYERMPSPARKLLMAGRGGLNITHSEPLSAFLGRYAPHDALRQRIKDAVAAYPPETVVAWANGLGQATFVGSSGRVFPKSMKASPLLRAWLRRLDAQGVKLATGHDWSGWSADGRLRFTRSDGSEVLAQPDAILLALGGASWPRLGSTGSWLALLTARGVETRPFSPSNCGIDIAWSEMLRVRFEGEPLKRIAVTAGEKTVRGEALVTKRGLEGGAIYALSEPIREMLSRGGPATIMLDLRPDLTLADLSARLAAPRQKQSTSNFLRKAAGIAPVAIALLREAAGTGLPESPIALAGLIKGVTLPVTGLAGLERAISSVGGIALEAVDDAFMLRALPGVFVAGEMLDWDAPTGGYLLQATLATAVAAARGLASWLDGSRSQTGKDMAAFKVLSPD